MADLPAFEREPYLTRLDAVVLRVGLEGARPYAVLDDSILFPEGGGQPADHGFLGEVAVLDVAKRDGEVRHYLAAPVPLGPVPVRLDWRRRFDHMQQHTGQHLLTAIAQDAFGWATTAFHLGEEVADIELATPLISPGELERLEEAVAAEIRAARPVSARRVSLEDYQALKVRSRGLPEGFQGEVRLVAIAGLDLNTCGGTHLAGTAELESLKLLGTEAIRGGTRLFFAAGGRARRRFGAHERRNAQLRTLLGAPDEGLAEALQTRLEQLRGLERRVRALEEELAEGAGAALAAAAEAFVERHFEGRDAGFLQKVGRTLAAAAPAKLALLTASLDGAAFFLLLAGDEAAVDVPALGRELAGLLQAKGGGSGRMFQGKAGSLAGRNEAVARGRAALA
jgi:Ser-tRNA(Ala) deacylase AlaX